MPNNQQDTKNQYILSSVDTALLILNLFLFESELSIAEIASRMNIGRTTAFRSIATLENRGYITKTSHGTYRLGIKMYTFGQLVYSRVELIPLVHPLLAKLADEFCETAHLSIFDGNLSVIYLDTVFSHSHLRVDISNGSRHLAHLTAAGKSILAFQTDQKLNQYIKKADFKTHTSNSITTAKDLLHELDDIREKSYASDNEEFEEGITCYAVPIIDTSQLAVASICISGSTQRIIKKKELIIERLKESANKIAQLLT